MVGAQEGTLAIMAGGDEAVIATLADVFKPLGRLTRVGPSGAGQLAKLANQQIVAVTIGAIAEAMVLVEKAAGRVPHSAMPSAEVSVKAAFSNSTANG